MIAIKSVSSQDFIATLEAKLLEQDIQPPERMAVDLMLRVARAAFPWFDEQFAAAREDLTLAPMILSASSHCAATILAGAVQALLTVNASSFPFVMEEFGRELAEMLGLHVDDEDDGAEPVAIADRPAPN